MNGFAASAPLIEGIEVTLPCDDGVVLGGHLWPSPNGSAGAIIINPATGVLARFYHRYARFLARHGFDVLTYDYRGIGDSRPSSMRGCGYRWRDWGLRDFEAALQFMRENKLGNSLNVIGHSIGGVIPGFAKSATIIDRLLTIGAQYAWAGDYARSRRMALFAKWHVAMPVITACFGYFPGKHLGWLEDLPAGVANEWSFRRSQLEKSFPRGERHELVERIANFRAPTLAICVSDDELGTMAAVRRALGYYANAPCAAVVIQPSYYGEESIGHFRLFRDEFAPSFWIETLTWLYSGNNPWPNLVVT